MDDPELGIPTIISINMNSLWGCKEFAEHEGLCIMFVLFLRSMTGSNLVSDAL